MLEHLGSETFIHLDSEGGQSMIARAEGGSSLEYGDTVYLSADKEKIHYFGEDGRTIAKE